MHARSSAQKYNRDLDALALAAAVAGLLRGAAAWTGSTVVATC